MGLPDDYLFQEVFLEFFVEGFSDFFPCHEKLLPKGSGIDPNVQGPAAQPEVFGMAVNHFAEKPRPGFFDSPFVIPLLEPVHPHQFQKYIFNRAFRFFFHLGSLGLFFKLGTPVKNTHNAVVGVTEKNKRSRDGHGEKQVFLFRVKKHFFRVPAGLEGQELAFYLYVGIHVAV